MPQRFRGWITHDVVQIFSGSKRWCGTTVGRSYHEGWAAVVQARPQINDSKKFAVVAMCLCFHRRAGNLVDEHMMHTRWNHHPGKSSNKRMNGEWNLFSSISCRSCHLLTYKVVWIANKRTLRSCQRGVFDWLILDAENHTRLSSCIKGWNACWLNFSG